MLGFPFVLFSPGYALMAALFPGKERMSGIERVALSFGLSMVVVPLTGLILNYTFGVTLDSIIWSLISFILVMTVIAWVRRYRLVKESRFSIEFQLAFPGWGGSVWDKTLSIILVVSVLGTLGMTGYLIAQPKTGESFNEFYILPLEGNADYSRQLVVGQEGKVIVGIVNSEHETMGYRLEVMIDGVMKNDIQGIILEHNEKWEQEVSIIPERVGDNQKLEFLLYKNGEAEPCLKPLHLWIEVIK